MRRALTSIAALLVLALAAACGSGDPEPTPTDTPTTTPTVTETSEPTPEPTPTPIAYTGIETIDEIIFWVDQKQLDQLLGVLEWQETPCTTSTNEGPGGPPQCEAGQANGTVVRVFPLAKCEGEFVRDPGNDLFLFITQAEALHSVVEAPDYERPNPAWPVGDTFINYRSNLAGEEVGIRLVIEDGQIVMIFFGCNHPPDLLLEDGGEALPVIYRAS